MARSLTKLNFNRISHAVSGFLTVIVMPLTYSIAYGLIAGIGTYFVMEGMFWILSFVGLEVPVDEEEASKLIIGEAKPKDESIEPSDNDDVEESSAKVETEEVTPASDKPEEVDEEVA
eukprot:scaffold3099_cov95-Skeletonema_marinoi.AAC.1